MIISEKTLSILSNFTKINPSIKIMPGNILRTLSPQMNIVVKAKLEEEFPKKICIYNLYELLSIMSLMKNPDLDFQDNKLIIRDGQQIINYFYTDEQMISCLEDEKYKDLPEQEYLVEFDISKDNLVSLTKAANILTVPDFTVRGDGEKLQILVTDMRNDSCSNFIFDVGEIDKEFTFVFKVNSINKLILFDESDYHIKIANNLGIFQSDVVKYWIAVEQNSSSGVNSNE